QYCDLLLHSAERTAWRMAIGSPPESAMAPLEDCSRVAERASDALQVATKNAWLLDIALDNLTFARAQMYGTILEGTVFDPASPSLEAAVDGLRRANQQVLQPLGFLTRAWARAVAGRHIGPDSAQEDLDEAWEIAERAPM